VDGPYCLGRELELGILETLWQNHVRRVGPLKVLVISGGQRKAKER
jgi:hypothetical protein